MTIDDSLCEVSVKEMNDKLKKLKHYFPKEEEIFYNYGKGLAEYIGETSLTPQGFLMANHLFLYDIAKGVSGYAHKKLPENLIGYPPQIYTLLGMRTTDIAKAVCPPDFAAKVIKLHNQMLQIKG
jgi:hypothetical protein